MNARYVYTAPLQKKDKKRKDDESPAKFKFLEVKENISNLKFNHEESCYIFHDKNVFFRLSVYEHAEEEVNQI